MTADLVFRLVGALFLACMAFVFWSGVGRKREIVGRVIAVVCAGCGAFLLWPVIDRFL